MVSAVVHAMHNLISGVFEHLKIIYLLNVYKRVNYMQSLLRGPALKKYKTVMGGCKELAKGISGYQWTLDATKDVTMEKI